MRRIPNIQIENAEVLPGTFRNFSGKPGKYNRNGDRNFNIIITDHKFAQQLIDDGWNVRILPPRNDDEEARYRLQITVNMKTVEGVPPTKVFTYTGNKKLQLTEETIGTLDWANYKYADLTIHPRVWIDDDGSEHVKAYLREMHVVIEPDKWAEKYAHYEEE